MMRTLEISTIYEAGIFGRFYLFNAIYKNGKYYFANLLPICMFFCALYALRTQQTGLAIFSVGSGLLVLLLIRKLIQLLIRYQLKTFRTLSGREVYRLRFSSAGLSVFQQRRQTADYRWSDLRRVYQLGNCYYVYQNLHHAYIVPTTEMSETDKQLFTDWMLDGIGQQKVSNCNNLIGKILQWEKQI